MTAPVVLSDSEQAELAVALPVWSFGVLPRLVPALRSLSRYGGAVRPHLVALAAVSATSAIGTVAAPALWRHPILLVALSPRFAFLALAAPTTALVPFLVVGTLRLGLTDPIHFDMGRRLGDRLLTDVAGRSRYGVIRRVARPGRAARWLVLSIVFLRPNGSMLAISGAQRTSPLANGVLALTGTAAYVTAVHVGVSTVVG